jgi:restriction endonuclease-like protein
MELDCANSSDALLMNIFCYRRTVENRALSSMLGIASGPLPVFGFNPEIPLRNGRTDRTEIDMRLGDLMVEAKLTETDFQTASARMIERYRDLEEVFDAEELTRSGDMFPCY